MTFTVAIAVTTKPLDVAISAPAEGQFLGRILNSNGEVVQQDTAIVPTYLFHGVPAGDYKAEVSRLDINGAVIEGSVVSTDFSTGPDAVAVPPAPTTRSIDVPATVSVTVTQE